MVTLWGLESSLWSFNNLQLLKALIPGAKCLLPVISDQPSLLALIIGPQSSIELAVSFSVSEKVVRVFLDLGLPPSVTGILDLRRAEEENNCRGESQDAFDDFQIGTTNKEILKDKGEAISLAHGVEGNHVEACGPDHGLDKAQHFDSCNSQILSLVDLLKASTIHLTIFLNLKNRFDPIVDAVTGRDLIPCMVYGRNIREQEFAGMFCAVLTVNSSVVSAGLIRVLGQEVAELPLVATSSDYQGQGYFHSLFCCIERLLGFLNVKTLVLPAAEEAEAIWTQKFGFQKMDHDQVTKYTKEYQLTVFRGTAVLHKPVPKCRIIRQSNEK